MLAILDNTSIGVAGLIGLYLPIYPPDYIIFDNWVFENFILADEPFPKTLWIFETFISVNNFSCEKLVPSLEFPIKFER